jgi:hypothetical protein
MRESDQPQAVPPRDLPALEALLRLTGAAEGADLLARLDEDLTRAVADLAAARISRDSAALRAVTHVLIAVAGALQAQPLTDDARRLNQAAQSAVFPTDAGLMQDVTAGLADLLHAIRARRTGAGGTG